MIRPACLFGVPFTPESQQELIEAVKGTSEEFYYVVTPNADHLVRVYRYPEYRTLYEQARFSVCDSRIIYLLSKLFVPSMLPEVVTGSDLTKALIAYALPRSARIAIIGCTKDAVEKVVRQYGLKDVLHYNPPMGFINSQAEVAKAVDFVVNARPDFTFFAVGSPQQEILANLVANTGRARGVGFCVGASFLFLSGLEKRAPRWMQFAGLEWLYRLLVNPRRMFKRYLVDAFYLIPIVFKESRNRLT